jgi:methylmalonyl-CoA mutase N-terminal domain/subunit
VQQARVASVRASRDATKWRACLDAIRNGAHGDANLFPLVVAAVQAHATVGEISDTLREVFSEASLV